MAPQETLQATHDVAEELQSKLESLPDVERAYVHVDYETSHKPVSLFLGFLSSGVGFFSNYVFVGLMHGSGEEGEEGQLVAFHTHPPAFEERNHIG